MSRPLIQKRIDELEELFEVESGNPRTLEFLEEELSFRTVPRAASLLSKVRRVIAGGLVAPSAKQNELFANKPQTPTQISFTRSAPDVISTSLPTVDQAQKHLKVTLGADWETVEQSRRVIVDKARPDRLASMPENKRKQIVEEARLANAAYRVLSENR